MDSPTSASVLIAAASAALVLVLAAAQSFMTAGIGSDHPVHRFLVRAVRRNQHRLFVRIPGVLNETHCGALPLYMHWVLSWLGPGGLRWAERLLNPVVSALHVLLVAAIVWHVGAARSEAWAGLVACAFALTPQFFHAFSARNFGLSARSPGLLFLTAFLAAAQAAPVHGWLAWAALVVAGWLVWGFSTFAMQAMVIFSMLLLPLTGHVAPLCGVLLGALLFVAVHPRYALAYLRSTRGFIGTYAREIAPIYVLTRRFSIWRDLVWDVWIAFRGGPGKGARYAYENSILVVLLLNPLLPIACWGFLAADMNVDGLEGFAGAVATTAGVAVALTSFRCTRFLGEPERYAEAAAPWAAIAGVPVVQGWLGTVGVLGALATFLLADLLQLALSRLLARHIRRKPTDHGQVTAAIAGLGIDVRCCCNNEQLTKGFMLQDWQFACCISASDHYCDMTFTEAFSTFPNLRRESMERIVTRCRVNVCVFDRSLYDTILAVPPEDLVGMRIVHESDGLRVMFLEWRPLSVCAAEDAVSCP